MSAKLWSWPVAAAAAAVLWSGGCQQFASWLPKQDKLAEAQKNAAARDAQPSAPVTAEQKVGVQLALARSFEDEKQFDQAAKIYLDILKKDPRSTDTCRRLALLYTKKGDWESSRKYFEIALKQDPKNADLHCDFGYSNYLQRRNAEADASLRRAIALDRDNGRAHNNLGLLLARGGQEKEALKEFAKAGCSEAQARANLAVAYAVDNRLDNARAQYRLALAADPNLKVAQDGLATLQSIDHNIVRVSGSEESTGLVNPVEQAMR